MSYYTNTLQSEEHYTAGTGHHDSQAVVQVSRVFTRSYIAKQGAGGTTYAGGGVA